MREKIVGLCLGALLCLPLSVKAIDFDAGGVIAPSDIAEFSAGIRTDLGDPGVDAVLGFRVEMTGVNGQPIPVSDDERPHYDILLRTLAIEGHISLALDDAWNEKGVGGHSIPTFRIKVIPNSETTLNYPRAHGEKVEDLLEEVVVLVDPETEETIEVVVPKKRPEDFQVVERDSGLVVTEMEKPEAGRFYTVVDPETGETVEMQVQSITPQIVLAEKNSLVWFGQGRLGTLEVNRDIRVDKDWQVVGKVFDQTYGGSTKLAPGARIRTHFHGNALGASYTRYSDDGSNLIAAHALGGGADAELVAELSEDYQLMVGAGGTVETDVGMHSPRFVFTKGFWEGLDPDADAGNRFMMKMESEVFGRVALDYRKLVRIFARAASRHAVLMDFTKKYKEKSVQEVMFGVEVFTMR